jgi:preprotein translocase subunit YajC
MPTGPQEIIALIIVVAVVVFALWRRRRRRGPEHRAGCDGCDAGGSAQQDEKPVRFYRRRDS